MKTSNLSRLWSTMPIALGLALATGCAHAPGETTSAEGEARLAEMLAGKTAGKPQSCIPARPTSDLTIIDETAVVYEAGSTIYVARPENPESLDSWDVLVVERFGGQLCKQDIIRTVDRSSGFTTGVVFLGDFVPYR